MREIEFRAKSKEKNEWIYGYLVKGETGNYYICKNLGHAFIWVDEKTIGQYTGLKDKNGTKIFEGDIYTHSDKDITYTVVWYDTSFKGKQNGSSSYAGLLAWLDSIEVTDNIYDESELN